MDEGLSPPNIYYMPESFEKHLAKREEEEEKSPEEIKKEKQALELAEEIKEIKEKMAKEGETIEGYKRIMELGEKIREIYEERETIGWKLEGELTQENVLAEYQTEDWINTVDFSPEGDKVAMGSVDGMMRVIGPKK